MHRQRVRGLPGRDLEHYWEDLCPATPRAQSSKTTTTDQPDEEIPG